MAIETVCSGCGRQLRVAEEHAGKLARCPNCNTIYRVPSPGGEPAAAPGGEPTAEPARQAPRPAPASAQPSRERPPGAGRGPQPAASSSSMWRMRTPEGQVYGPVPRHELNDWVAEGRVSSDCELRENDGEWRWADRVFPQLTRRGGRTALAAAGDGDSPYYVAPGAQGRRMVRDRGSTVLALGIMSWVVLCPPLSLSAWIMGAHDLREMRAGRMTTGGMGMTQAGMVLGIVNFVAAALIFLIALAASFG